VSEALSVLLDQNVPRPVAVWLRGLKPLWTVYHVKEVGLDGKPDQEIFAWAQEHRAIVITFDEDFADQRSFPVGLHYGVVRLRVWPTTIEETENALARLFSEVSEHELSGALVIIDRARIRVRAGKRPSAP
jgi:predicted nuclease of predicted toxin-antitoxin system